MLDSENIQSTVGSSFLSADPYRPTFVSQNGVEDMHGSFVNLWIEKAETFENVWLTVLWFPLFTFFYLVDILIFIVENESAFILLNYVPISQS